MSTQQNIPAAASDEASLPPLDERPDAWTRARQAAFLRALSATHNVAASARSVGMSRQSAYKLRARLRGQPFDYAWAAAFQSQFDALAEAAMERAMNGVEVQHYHQGELVGTSRRYDERLTLALLAMRGSFRPAPVPTWHAASAYDPDEFGALVARVEQGPESWREERGDDDDE
jgi:hypothetical protein